jgi:hypothetical protein
MYLFINNFYRVNPVFPSRKNFILDACERFIHLLSKYCVNKLYIKSFGK